MDDNKSRVDKLRDNLYSRTRYKDPEEARSRLKSTDNPDVQESWEGPDLDEMLKYEREQENTHPIVRKIFLSALIFFGFAILVAGYVFFGGANFVSSKNVDISVLGPTAVSAGEVFELGVTVTNRNNADLDLANLTIQYASGTREAEDTTKSLNYTEDKLGEVRAGREAVRTVRAVLFGSPGEVKQIKFSVEYKVKGSNATFYKDKIYDITIGETPLIFSVESPHSVNSGDSFTTNVEVVLNSSDTLRGVMVRAEYPYGYTVTSAVPKAVASDNVWSLGDMLPGEKKSITIKGQLVGENSEERTFRFYTGVSDSGDNPNFRTIISSALNTITIDRPSVSLGVTLNNDSSQTVITSVGNEVNASIKFQNNLTDKLLNPKLEVRLSGSALDKFSITTQGGGFYDSLSNKITWNLSNGFGQFELAPGDRGQVSFRFSSVLNPSSTQSGREIGLEFSLTGTPLDTPGGRPVTVTEKRTVRISSEISLSSEGIYSRGSFTNKGPIPPKAETETTYTINLRAVNTQAEVGTSYVLAKLGQNVSWLGSSGDEVSYDAVNNVITWDIGTLTSGAGSSLPGKSASFQVSLTPSLSQVGTAPTLVSDITFTGIDSVTSRETKVYNPAVTTRISNDPTFVQGDEYVIK